MYYKEYLYLNEGETNQSINIQVMISERDFNE